MFFSFLTIVDMKESEGWPQLPTHTSDGSTFGCSKYTGHEPQFFTPSWLKPVCLVCYPSSVFVYSFSIWCYVLSWEDASGICRGSSRVARNAWPVLCIGFYFGYKRCWLLHLRRSFIPSSLLDALICTWCLWLDRLQPLLWTAVWFGIGIAAQRGRLCVAA
jgi:hypothetical protein